MLLSGPSDLIVCCVEPPSSELPLDTDASSIEGLVSLTLSSTISSLGGGFALPLSLSLSACGISNLLSASFVGSYRCIIIPAPNNGEEFILLPSAPTPVLSPVPFPSPPSLPTLPEMEAASGCFSKCVSGKSVDRTPIPERISSSKQFSDALSLSLKKPTSSSPLSLEASSKLFGARSKSMPPENSSMAAAFVCFDSSIIFLPALSLILSLALYFCSLSPLLLLSSSL
mmetsp:Transcript_22891/g.41066  ORF Transcript_22891/g.41066 Transcript_22891/m.41066 type:complete len:228 (+) Transcript_22891:777-1460(+)